jgi:hypothetical protein
MNILRSIFYSFFISLVLQGCQPVQPPPPEEPCPTALVCTKILSKQDAVCRDTADRTEYLISNHHPNKKVVVAYREHVRHVNDITRPDQYATKILEIDPKDSEVTLGCKRTRGLLDEQWDEWSFLILSTCFEGECPVNFPKPTQHRDPRTSCEKLCNNQDKSCFNVSFTGNLSPLGGEMARLTSSLAFKPFPVSHPMSGFAAFANIWTGDNSCTREPLRIDKTQELSAAGTTCRVGAVVANNSLIKEMEIVLAGEITGQITRSTPDQYRVLFNDLNSSPLLRLKQQVNGSDVYEHIMSISGHRGEMTVTGENYYCGRFNWNEEGIIVKTKGKKYPK